MRLIIFVQIDLSSWQAKIEGTNAEETKVVHEPYDHRQGTIKYKIAGLRTC